MNVYSWQQFLSGSCTEAVAASIGVFDGFHLGHRNLLAQLKSKTNLPILLCTFFPNPKALLYPQEFEGYISTQKQNQQLALKLGVHTIVCIDFSTQFSTMKGKEFLAQLVHNANIRHLTIGSTFHCGYSGDTNASAVIQFFSRYGTEVSLLPLLEYKGAIVSSSRIRSLVRQGLLAEVAELLGRPYCLEITVQIQAGFYEVLSTPGQVSPPPGRYSVVAVTQKGNYRQSAVLDSQGRWYLQPQAKTSDEANALSITSLQLLDRQPPNEKKEIVCP